MICEYSEMGAKEVETEVIAAPSNGESFSFCLGITCSTAVRDLLV